MSEETKAELHDVPGLAKRPSLRRSRSLFFCSFWEFFFG